MQKKIIAYTAQNNKITSKASLRMRHLTRYPRQPSRESSQTNIRFVSHDDHMCQIPSWTRHASARLKPPNIFGVNTYADHTDLSPLHSAEISYVDVLDIWTANANQAARSAISHSSMPSSPSM
jgi:hypothetical protein